MRRGKLVAVLATVVVAGCTSYEPLKDMVGYVPPTSLPAQPKRTLVADGQEQVWAQLVDFLEATAFEIDHIDEEKQLLIARYSGDPEPYLDCGSIVTHQNGTLGQIAGSASTVALNYEVEQEPVVLNRSLNLDSRIIMRLSPQSEGTLIETETTYVVTKTVDIEDTSGGITRGSRETVSFKAGKRGEFSKGTACQPNGSLDVAVLQSLPNIIGSSDIDQADLLVDDVETAAPASPEDDAVAALPTPTQPPASPTPDGDVSSDSDLPPRGPEERDADDVPSPQADLVEPDWVLPEQGLPRSALPAPEPVTPSRKNQAAGRNPAAAGAKDIQPTPDGVASRADTGRQNQGVLDANPPGETAVLAPQAAIDDTEAGKQQSSSNSIVDDTTRKLLSSLDCSGNEWHFCDLIEMTTPYRKRNIEKLLGLTINTSESFTSQVVGRDLKLDILFPNFPSHLHIAYVRRDGMIEHVMSSDEVWPADLAYKLAEADRRIPGPTGLAMIIAIASDKPLFSSPPERAEDAALYLGRLQQRLGELETDDPDGLVAASQLLIYVDKAET